MIKQIGVIALVTACMLSLSTWAMSTYGPTQSGDTLWSIAVQAPLSKKTSMTEMMDAIYALNPQAFKGKKHNLMLKESLQIPTTKAELNHALGKGPLPQANRTITQTSKVKMDEPMALEQSPVIPLTQRSKVKLHTPIEQSTNSDTSQDVQRLHDQLANSAPVQQGKEEHLSSAAGTTLSDLVILCLLVALGYYLWRRHLRKDPSDQSHTKKTADRLGRKLDDRVTFARYSTENIETKPFLKWVKNARETPGSGELLANVMIYMAEGQYITAKNELLIAIKKNSRSIELRMRLLEVYAKMNDKRAFEAEAKYLTDYLISKTDQSWTRIRSIYLSQWVYEKATT